MKNNLLRTATDWLLATSVILSVVLFIQYYFRSHELRSANLEWQKDQFNYQQFRMNLNAQLSPLLADVNEYSKRNPAINPILEQFQAKPPAPATAPAKPASK